MARVCTVCNHPARDEIDRALIAGEACGTIAARYRTIGRMALQRHKTDHIPSALARAQEAQEAARADSLLGQVKAVMARVQKLFDACDRWLVDPEDPSRYEIGPRAEDVQVTYTEEGKDGKRVRRKARLSTILAQVGEGRRGFEVVEVKHADPRELVLKTANTLRAALEMLFKVTEVKELEARLAELEKVFRERGAK